MLKENIQEIAAANKIQPQPEKSFKLLKSVVIQLTITAKQLNEEITHTYRSGALSFTY